MRSAISYEEPANRLTNGLRFFWIIPAAIVAAIIVAIAAAVVLVISWFTIVITGKQSRGLVGLPSQGRFATHSKCRHMAC